MPAGLDDTGESAGLVQVKVLVVEARGREGDLAVHQKGQVVLIHDMSTKVAATAIVAVVVENTENFILTNYLS